MYSWILLALSIVVVEAHAGTLDTERIFNEVSDTLCDDIDYLECIAVDHLLCVSNMDEIGKSCRKPLLLASSSDPLEPQIQRGVIECIVKKHTEMLERNRPDVDRCYLDRKNR